MRNIRLKVAYEGTCYLGWQKTEMGPSIEGSLQQTLKQILRQDVVLQAASRTDAGVHAKGQVVNFLIESNTPNLIKLMYGLNSLLPKDIAIMDIGEAPAGFHPTLDCIGKEYHYSVCCGTAQMPHRRFYSWHFPRALDMGAMRRAAGKLSGEHDFSAFCNLKKNSTYSHHVRCVHEIEIIEHEEKQLLFIIRGNNFLYKMVRNLVGTLLYVGCGKIAEESIPAILGGKDRKQAGITAPSHGLCLYSVKYDYEL
jgi:tRNA pseudouridine38-40 synthase